MKSSSKVLALSFGLAFMLITTGLQAQKFWLTTYEFPGGPKTGIAAVRDTCLFAGLTQGVLRSFNEGYHWDTVLAAEAVFTVHATDAGVILAGGRGKIYISPDYGNHWDSLSLGNTYPVTKFVHNASGDFFAITGELTTNDGFVGAGVYYSADAGAHWNQRNNGLGAYLSCDQLAIDKNGRLYVTTTDEYLTGNGGLFISDNNGTLWEHIDIKIDGLGVIADDVAIETSAGLDVSPDDSVILSFAGKTGSAAVYLNICKSISDIRSGSFWRCMKVGNSSMWWYDRMLNGIHFAKNGDYYSSSSGSLATGGTFFSKNKGATWNKHQQGLGFDIYLQFGRQIFAEVSSGKVFMVQYLDERIYYADTSRLITGIDESEEKNHPAFTVYPNPANAYLSIKAADLESATISVYDLKGSKLLEQRSESELNVLCLPAGIYFIEMINKGSMVRKKFVKL